MVQPRISIHHPMHYASTQAFNECGRPRCLAGRSLPTSRLLVTNPDRTTQPSTQPSTSAVIFEAVRRKSDATLALLGFIVLSAYIDCYALLARICTPHSRFEFPFSARAVKGQDERPSGALDSPPPSAGSSVCFRPSDTCALLLPLILF
jgi:hypothetical protein